MANTKGAYKLTEVKKAEILELARLGMDTQKIARRAGVSGTSVRNVCRAAGLELPRKRRKVRLQRTTNHQAHAENNTGNQKLDTILDLLAARETGAISPQSFQMAISSIVGNRS